MYTCDDVIGELSSFLDDEISPEVRLEVEAHLRNCSTCRILYDSARKTLRIVTDTGSFEIPGGLTRKIMARLKAQGRLDPE
jgi:predicted anti-sigma-YlaC factor YlaD